MCCICGAIIKKNRANLDRHELIYDKNKQSIKCVVAKCSSTFQNKNDYYAHWKRKHSGLDMPDGFNYVPTQTKSYRKKFQGVKYIEPSSDLPRPNDFLLLNYLGLIPKGGDVHLILPRPGPFFGKLIWDEHLFVWNRINC